MARKQSIPKSMTDMTTLMLWSPFVIASRMSGFWLSAAAPTAESNAEATKMVVEKMEAAGESIMAAQAAIAAETIRAATSIALGRQPDAHYGERIAAASLKPYSKRVRANAKRLSRRP